MTSNRTETLVIKYFVLITNQGMVYMIIENEVDGRFRVG